MEKESRLKDFLANPYKSMWTMAMPIIAGMMVQTLFNVVDIMFIGWLGADEVTAVAFVSPLFFIIIGLGVGIGTGATATIAQYIGQKDRKNAAGANDEDFRFVIDTASKYFLQVNPLLTFYSAVARKNIEGSPSKGFLKENALNRVEALKGMTIWAAYSNFEDSFKGSIEIGKFADFVILTKDIMEVPEEEITKVDVVATIVNGSIVFQKIY